MSAEVLLINDEALSPPQILTAEETEELARFNSMRSAGHLFDEETLRRMKMLQLRFDWLGNLTEDGEAHAGRFAMPAVITARPVRRGLWRR